MNGDIEKIIRRAGEIPTIPQMETNKPYVPYATMTIYFKECSPFSNWHPSCFYLNDQTFFHMEQYVVWAKAQLFRDQDISQKVIKKNYTPKYVEQLEKQIKSFHSPTWKKYARDIVYRGLFAKFTQNPELAKALEKTKNTTLVEAGCGDLVWSAGLLQNDVCITDPLKWKGTNWMGEVLTRLRIDLFGI